MGKFVQNDWAHSLDKPTPADLHAVMNKARGVEAWNAMCEELGELAAYKIMRLLPKVRYVRGPAGRKPMIAATDSLAKDFATVFSMTNKYDMLQAFYGSRVSYGVCLGGERMGANLMIGAVPGSILLGEKYVTVMANRNNGGIEPEMIQSGQVFLCGLHENLPCAECHDDFKVMTIPVEALARTGLSVCPECARSKWSSLERKNYKVDDMITLEGGKRVPKAGFSRKLPPVTLRRGPMERPLASGVTYRNPEPDMEQFLRRR